MLSATQSKATPLECTIYALYVFCSVHIAPSQSLTGAAVDAAEPSPLERDRPPLMQRWYSAMGHHEPQEVWPLTANDENDRQEFCASKFLNSEAEPIRNFHRRYYEIVWHEVQRLRKTRRLSAQGLRPPS